MSEQPRNPLDDMSKAEIDEANRTIEKYMETKEQTMTDWISVEVPTHPQHKWVKVVAFIRKNDTGEVRKYHRTSILENDGIVHDYSWRDGNCSCDCNRELFFLRAGNEPEPDDTMCGDERYSVNLQNPKTGEIFYREYEDE